MQDQVEDLMYKSEPRKEIEKVGHTNSMTSYTDLSTIRMLQRKRGTGKLLKIKLMKIQMLFFRIWCYCLSNGKLSNVTAKNLKF